jgi:hypothetical protein
MGFDAYGKNRAVYSDISGSVALTAASTSQNLTAVAKTNETIFIQKFHIEVTTGVASKTWTIDDTGTPFVLSGPYDVSAVTHFDRDYGPQGVPLTVAKELHVTISAAGSAGTITWEGYRKRTAVGAP